jgi:hypothetical protein
MQEAPYYNTAYSTTEEESIYTPQSSCPTMSIYSLQRSATPMDGPSPCRKS